MKRALLSRLVSPCCGATLRFSALETFPLTEKSSIDEGSLACVSCKREYPIIASVPRLAVDAAASARAARTRDSFTWEWTRYPGSLPQDRGVFLEEVQMPAEGFQGKSALDAGCGMGRYAVVALSLGAEVVAVDFSDSLLRLADLAYGRPKLHVVQADLLRPPFKAGSFDIVYSHGVLHHTRDARAAFMAIARLVKPGGHLSVWLYGKAGRFADFKTNPIRAEKSWARAHPKSAWLIVALRQWISNAVRFVTTRLPLRLTYALCYPLALAGAVPGLKYLTFSVERGFMVRVMENFDWLSPPFQSHHTKEELASWFEQAGFTVVKVLPHGLVPKPGILGRKNG